MDNESGIKAFLADLLLVCLAHGEYLSNGYEGSESRQCSCIEVNVTPGLTPGAPTAYQSENPHLPFADAWDESTGRTVRVTLADLRGTTT